MTVSKSTPATLVLLLRRADSASNDEFLDAWSMTMAQTSDVRGLVRRERFETISEANAIRGDLPKFAADTYDGLDFIEFGSVAGLEAAVSTGQLATALAGLAESTDVSASAFAVTCDRVVFGPSASELVTIGCLQRQPHFSWDEFDELWFAHTRLTDALRDAGILAGYVQSHLLLGPFSPGFPGLAVGDTDLPAAPWDGITRGFWPSEQALHARTEMADWLAECSADERLFIDHARSLNQLTRRRPSVPPGGPHA